MPLPIESTQGYQSQSIRRFQLADGETALVEFAAARDAKVNWDNGGVTWTIREEDESADTFSVVVEHSILPIGYDAHGDWVPDEQGPFTEPSQGEESFRIERIRYTNTGDTVIVVVAAPSKITVSLS